ncbi:MAG: hypothetical protein ABR968_08320 [Bacteroidales bacterium]|jgi:hypothetical protein
MKTKHLKIKTVAFVTLLCGVIFVSCSKDRLADKTTTTSTAYAPLNNFYSSNAPTQQSFTIDSTGGDTIRAASGTKIWGIPKTIFMYQSTHQDINYPYTLKLIEAYGIKNMMLEQLPNVAQGNILQAAGELNVLAYKDTSILVLKEHCGLPMWAPSTITPDAAMKVYYGFTSSTTNDWNIDVRQTNYLFPSDPDTVTKLSVSGSGYLMKIAKLGWVGINHTFSYTGASMTFSVSGTATNTNYIDLYIIFKNRHSFIKVSSLAASNLPTGDPITVFAIANDTGGQMYYFEQDYTISNGLAVTITMSTTTQANILSLMGAF